MGAPPRALREICRRRSVVLAYHGVADTRRRDDLSMLHVPPQRFRAQIELLRDAGFRFLTLADFARMADGRTPPPGYAAITFDDGMRNNHRIALPILSALGVPATVYVTVGFIGAQNPWIGPGGDGSSMTALELRELAAAGWEIGAHTMTHPDMSELSYEACVQEVEDSRTALERLLDAPIETFAYPFGRYGPDAVAAVHDSPLIAAVTTGSGRWDRYEMTRAPIGSADPWPVMLLKLCDRYEPLIRPLYGLRVASKRLRGGIQSRQRSA